MRLTDGHRPAPQANARPRLSPRWTVGMIGGGLLAVFQIDWATGSAPFQHLYYMPVIVAALRFGRRGAWVSALSAVVLYHLANPSLLLLAHERSDVVQIVGFFGVGAVTAWLKEDARHQEAIAGTDDLTGRHNLRGFEHRLRSAVRDARETGRPLSLLVADLDGLKALNDVHGHLAGAEAVRTVGHTIAAHVPPKAFACRYGGDEFVIALPGQPASVAGDTACAILRAVWTTAPTLAGIAFPPGSLSVSIGVVSWCGDSTGLPGEANPDDVLVGEALFRAADAALYQAERAGRGSVSVASG